MKFVFFADTHLDHSTNGPKHESGYPQRVIDILENIHAVINFAIERKVDFLLFGGDAYKTSKPLEEYRVMFRKEILRAVEHGIKCVLIPGNHDMTKRFTADHCLAEFRHYDNVWVIDEPTLLDFGDVAIYGLPWQYSFEPTQLQLDKFTICMAHCTVLGAVFQSGNTAEATLGKDFGVDLEFFEQFDLTCLGHIHRPQVLLDDPFVGYPGSAEFLTWGEIGDPHGFYYYDGFSIEHVPYNHRSRIEVEWHDNYNVPVDSEAMYRVTVKSTDVELVNNYFKNAFDLTLISLHERHEMQERSDVINEDMSNGEILWNYWANIGLDENEALVMQNLAKELFDEALG